MSSPTHENHKFSSLSHRYYAQSIFKGKKEEISRCQKQIKKNYFWPTELCVKARQREKKSMKNEEMSHEKLWYRFRQQALETDSCHDKKESTNSAHFQACCRTFSQLITLGKIRIQTKKRRTHLCVVNFECAARRINVAAIEILTCTSCRVDRIKFDHRLNAILLEYHNTKHLAVRMTDCVNYLLQKNTKNG